MWEFTLNDGIILSAVGWLMYREYVRHGCIKRIEEDYKFLREKYDTEIEKSEKIHEKLDDRLRDVEKE